jgi:hypothetical protein
MIQRLLLAFLGLFVAHSVAQVPTPMPSLYPLPPVTYSTTGSATGAATYQPVMKFGTIALPPVNISFANTDYTAHYILKRALNCGLGITTSPILFVESANTPNSITASVKYLNVSAWTSASTPLITAGCSTVRPTVSATPTMTIRVVERPSQSPTRPPADIVLPPERHSETATMTPKVQEPTKPPADVIMPPERPSESSSATPNVQEPTVAPADVIVPPEQLPSETPTMTPRVLEKPSESSTPTMTVRVVERPSESSTMTPKMVEQRPSESSTPTMTVRVVERPSESSTMTARVIQKPSESSTPTMTIRVVERPSESSTMTPKMVERSSESSTMTARVIQKPSESSTLTPTMTVRVVERPSESSTMTPKMVERSSESSTMTPRVVERPSESSTMTARVIQKPSESSTLTPTMTVRVVERPSESSTMTPKMVERSSESSTMTPKMVERPSESSTMTPKMVERPSESATMTPKMVERSSESSTMTPKMVERPSESSTMTPKMVERPSESSTMTQKMVERSSESSTMTPKMVERPSESATVASIVFDQRISQSVSATPTSSRTPLQSYYVQYLTSNKPTATPARSRTASRTPYPRFSTRPTVPAPTKAPTRYPVASAYIQLVPTRVLIKSKKPIAIPSGYMKPAIIGSSVTFSGANTTTVTQPAQLQQLQAALACALGTPLENIQITNITYVDSTGKPNTVVFDASVAQLNSNGSVVCYTSGTTTTPAPTLRGRRLQAVSNDQVVIEYAILDPPTEILLSDPTTFIDTVTNAASIQDYASTVDSTTVAVDVPIELLSYAAVANAPTGPETPTTSAALNGATIAGITLCVVGVIGIAGAIMAVRKRKADQHKIITRTVNVVEMNPVARNLTPSESSKVVYMPNQVR